MDPVPPPMSSVTHPRCCFAVTGYGFVLGRYEGFRGEAPSEIDNKI